VKTFQQPLISTLALGKGGPQPTRGAMGAWVVHGRPPAVGHTGQPGPGRPQHMPLPHWALAVCPMVRPALAPSTAPRVLGLARAARLPAGRRTVTTGRRTARAQAPGPHVRARPWPLAGPGVLRGPCSGHGASWHARIGQGTAARWGPRARTVGPPTPSSPHRGAHTAARPRLRVPWSGAPPRPGDRPRPRARGRDWGGARGRPLGLRP